MLTKDKKVRSKNLIILYLTTTLIVACQGTPLIKFQPSDQKIATGHIESWVFDKLPINSIPPGTEVFSGDWKVRPEADTPTLPHSLCQTANAEYPALSLSDTIYTNVIISTQFKPISGQTDQAAGIIFRIQDKDNYYILRANALESNVSFYKYAGGIRSFIKEDNAEIPTGKWQELRVNVQGNKMQAFLNGKLIVEITDDTYSAGKVGLWTKADSVTCFDNVEAIAQK